MKAGDLFCGGNECYRIISKNGKSISVRLVAGKTLDVAVHEVPQSFMEGKTLYRPISEIIDVDAEMAMAEVSSAVDVAALGWNARLWVEAFLKRYEMGHPVPDAATLLGWFSNMVSAGEEKVHAEQLEAKKLAATKKRQAALRKKRAEAKKQEASTRKRR